MTLHEVLREKLQVSDEEFGSLCRPKISRATIWAYRTGARLPDAPQAVAVLSALRKLGVEMTLAELIAKPSRRPTRHRAA
jgi:hypothetical protein